MVFDFSKIKIKDPEKLRFGTAGIPMSTEAPNTESGVKQVRKLGLDAMELEFVHSVNLNPDTAAKVYEAKTKNDVTLTCHGSYYINLNAQEAQKIGASRSRVLQAANMARQAGAWSMTFHAAFYLGMEKEQVMRQVVSQFKKIIEELENNGNKIWIRPETTGKPTQWGDIDETIKLAQEVEQVLPCVDFAHLHARTNGKYNTTAEWQQVLGKIEKGLGKEGLNNMHIHMSGINYGEKGEKNHLFLDESDFKYKDLVKVWKEFKIKGAVISESPNPQTDALILQKEYGK